MVMVTRSAFKRASESWNSDISAKNIIPPWCSSGRGHVNKRYIKSVYPQENWENWYNSNDKENLKRKCGRLNKQILYKSSKNRIAKFLIIPLALSLIMMLLSPDNAKTFLTSFLSKPKIKLTSVTDECCDRMSRLTLQLDRAERKLRNTLRVRRVMFNSQNIIREPTIQRGYIAGCKVTKGSSTMEWGGNVALWGVVPLWRVSPPPGTVLALRPPTPADCWPFRGSYGEIIIQLPRRSFVGTASVEHVRPDITRSAPKHFTLFGILENGTWVKSAEGEYSYNKPAKQYFSLATKNIPLKQIVFRVLSNQGNTKYTCIYRVHLYSNFNRGM